MDFKHTMHMEHIVAVASDKLKEKYTKGNEEHGGFLPDKPNLIDEAIDEAIDMVVYLITLKDQIDELKSSKKSI